MNGVEMAEVDGRVFPVAGVRLVRGRECWLWEIPECPLCGQPHIHGGGYFNGDPRECLGHRLSHCQESDAAGFGGYILVEAEGSR
jgi:hypothetical protein